MVIDSYNYVSFLDCIFKFVDWQSSQHSLLNLAITKPSPGSTTLEDVLDSLLGLPPAVPRIASPQNSPRRAPSPYYMLGLQVCFLK